MNLIEIMNEPNQTSTFLIEVRFDRDVLVSRFVWKIPTVSDWRARRYPRIGQ